MSEDADPPDTTHKDPVWADFERTDRINREYRKIQEQDEKIIQHAANSNDVVYSALALRPDNKMLLLHEGHEGEAPFVMGDPRTIVGEIPPQTQELIDDLLATFNAAADPERSTEQAEVWIGEFNGQKVKIIKLHGRYASHNKEYDGLPTLGMEAASMSTMEETERPNQAPPTHPENLPAEQHKRRRGPARMLLNLVRRHKRP